MKYIALLRGVNVGGNKKIEMKKLKALFEFLGYADVSTYINSGNVVFKSSKNKTTLQREIEVAIAREFGFEVHTLVKTSSELHNIVKAVPCDWQNNNAYKTDVAFLFPEIDNENIIDDMPINKTYLEVIYVKGAVAWRVNRDDYNKSRLNKLVSFKKFYNLATIRNINTVRYLADRGK